MKRESAYYWVKYGGRWTIGQYDSEDDSWIILSHEGVMKDNRFNTIDENKIPTRYEAKS